MEHWAKIFFGKITPKLVQNTFGQFGNDFGHFWKIEKIFSFFTETFRRLDTPWNTGQKIFSKKLPRKHVQNTFAHFWERFWAFLEFWKLFDFLKTFRRLDPPWNTGQKKFSKKLPQNMFKTRLDTFGNDFVQLWNFEKFLIFWNHFEDSTIHGTLGKKNFRKNYLKTCSKRVWTLLGTILCNYEILKVFWFLKNISKTRPSMEHWAKIFFGKITSKHVQNTFGHFWERFCAIMKFWKIFDFLKTFRRLDHPWNTGQKFFSEKLPQNLFKTRLDNLGTILGIFGKLKNF